MVYNLERTLNKIQKIRREEGIKEGRKQEKYEIAKNLLDILDEETIANKIALTVDEVRRLKH